MANNKRNFEQGGGLDSLFSKTKKSSAQKGAASQIQEEEQPTAQREETLSGRADIISTIEDAELRAALRAKRMEGRGRPRKGTNKESLSSGYIRACLWMNEAKYNRLREIGLKETKTIKELIEAAIDLALSKYEKTGKL